MIHQLKMSLKNFHHNAQGRKAQNYIEIYREQFFSFQKV